MTKKPNGPELLEIADIASGRTARSVGALGPMPGASSLSRSGDVVASAISGATRSVAVWSSDAQRLAHRFTTPNSLDGSSSQALSPDGELFALGEGYDRITLWSTRSGTLVGALDGAPSNARHLTFSNDSAWILASSAGRAWLWRTRDRRLVAELAVTQRGDALCAVSPDGRVQVVGDGAPACAACRVGPFMLPADACGEDPTVLADVVGGRRQP
jgi:WD40 repeat protein